MLTTGAKAAAPASWRVASKNFATPPSASCRCCPSAPRARAAAQTQARQVWGPARARGLRAITPGARGRGVNGGVLQEEDKGPRWLPRLPNVELGTADGDARAFAVACARVAEEVKCDDVVVLHVAPLVTWTSYLVLCTVYSKPQLLAALSKIEQAAAECWGRAKQNLPGTSPWEVLDYGDAVIHVFTPEERERYDLESFYGLAEEVALEQVEEQTQQQSSQPLSDQGSRSISGRWTVRATS